MPTRLSGKFDFARSFPAAAGSFWWIGEVNLRTLQSCSFEGHVGLHSVLCPRIELPSYMDHKDSKDPSASAFQHCRTSPNEGPLREVPRSFNAASRISRDWQGLFARSVGFPGMDTYACIKVLRV